MRIEGLSSAGPGCVLSLALVFDNSDPESVKMLCFAAVAIHRSPNAICSPNTIL